LTPPEDFVRLEIAAALRRNIAVIPVLVQGAAMPSKEELPPDLQALAWRNATELRHTRWDTDFAELAATLQSHSAYVGPPQAPRRLFRWRWPVLAALSLAVLAIAVTAVLRLDRTSVPVFWLSVCNGEVIWRLAARCVGMYDVVFLLDVGALG
jgi:hypothetical protein